MKTARYKLTCTALDVLSIADRMQAMLDVHKAQHAGLEAYAGLGITRTHLHIENFVRDAHPNIYVEVRLSYFLGKHDYCHKFVEYIPEPITNTISSGFSRWVNVDLRKIINTDIKWLLTTKARSAKRRIKHSSLTNDDGKFYADQGVWVNT